MPPGSPELAEDQTVMNHKLYLFLGQHDQFSTELKKSLASVQGFEDTLIDVASACVDLYERKQFVLPETKFMYLKVNIISFYFIHLFCSLWAIL